MGEEWCTIESDPGVFTSLCEEIGVKGVQFEEIYGLEPEALVATGLDPAKIFGLVFLFKWKKEAVERPTVQAEDYGLFFAQQVIQNACATQAILNILLNQAPEKLDVGVNLAEFKNFSAGLDSAMKGEVLNNSEVIRKAHNSFRHQSSFEIVKDEDEKGGDAFHFVGYVCVDKKVYELDGLQKGPILIGDAPAEGPWYETALTEIKRRTETYQKAATGEEAIELRFNLMAIVANKLLEAEKKIELKRYLRQRVNISLVSQGEDVLLEDEVDDDEAPAEVPTFEDLSTREVPDLKKMVEDCNKEIDELNIVVEAEKKIRAQWAKENARRRFDLVPLALCAMRHLARRKELIAAFDKGKAAHLKRLEDKKAAETATAKA
jgi:ubiquitin carboxyl-terminal hydrolase L5|mmetsp:Transcript_93851/g.148255  ORF Transcript_93851/g.148255 Transcript_93851/m.148255 type:complete len:377 (-) Transcript_93851:95-1225(-)|eukprot:CAMPEP_0169099808 /NCGR_PEP_ID=MMETSP1015-20121227/20752_1 /TAXON_ID=342587 /ORGANISM="Karlodinium micrum, Strain CCMP2283" /LENGTH=376 /DNA_ID=CAMNT_0009160709 /DNA_START=74 /DNA_END=1204 /DNA_ORIENTATION=+